MTKGIEDTVEDVGKPQLRREIEPLIEVVLTALGSNKLSFKEEYTTPSKDRLEIYSQLYWIGCPENRRHLDFTHIVPKKPYTHTNFIISYRKFIARTSNEVKQLQSSGLIERVKKLSAGTVGLLTADYFKIGNTTSGIIVQCSHVDNSNPVEITNVARYIKQVDSLVAEYMQTIQTKKGHILNNRIH